MHTYRHSRTAGLKINDYEKAGDSRAAKACEPYQILWSMSAYTASDKRGSSHARLSTGPSGYKFHRSLCFKV